MIAINRLKFIAGLSLLELLVIIGAGAVLASILLPGLSQIRYRARTQSCASNLRMLGKAVIVYADDNNGMLPYAEGSALPRTHPTSRYPQGSIATSLREKLQPYIEKYSAFECPNDCGVSSYGIDGRACELFGSSYLWNDGSERYTDGTARLSVNGVSMSDIPSPKHTPMCWDYSPDWHQQLTRNGIQLVMSGRVNVVYVDGHIQKLQQVQPIQPPLQTDTIR